MLSNWSLQFQPIPFQSWCIFGDTVYNAWGNLQFISKANGMYTTEFAFRTNIMEDIF